jgi:putative oxygen-independent coproporphyrinogen III oxidase
MPLIQRMSRLVAPPLSLYLHFPWCVRKCPYCDFNSYTLNGQLQEAGYLEALERDLETQAPDVAGREVISVFMGGGTPSLFSPSAIDRVLAAARRHMTFASDLEVTMEANPGTIERGRFAEYRAAGVNRVSLGAQSFDTATLHVLGRIHSPDETRRAAEELHAAGLTNFNLDLMYALPGQDVAAALADVESAIALKPTHLSHYQLTLEPGTVFAAQPPANLPDDDMAAEILAACGARLAEAGFGQYEVSAYAQPGRQCRHNLNYWTFGDYLGVGAGAHGKITVADPVAVDAEIVPPGNGHGFRARASEPHATLGAIIRTTQSRDPRRYVAAPTATRTSVPEEQKPFEFMLNALRLIDGFDIATFEQRTGLPWETVAPEVEKLLARQLLEVQGTRLRTTMVGLRFLNNLLLSFLQETPRLTGGFGLSTAI